MKKSILSALPAWWPICLGLLGIAVRVCVWWFSIGSNDAEIWSSHAVHVLANGVTETYQKYHTFPQFNHPPLMGLYAAEVWSWAAGDLWTFARLIKLPGLAGEAVAMWALWQFAGRRAFAVYACLPAPILVSSFHGSTDCLYAALVLVGAISFDKKRYFLSGILWSASLNVKLLPLFLIPLVMLGTPHRKALMRLAAGFAIGMTPFLPFALGAGAAMYKNMIVYNSRPENWGVVALLNSGAASSQFGWFFGPLREWWLFAGRYAILLAIAAVALLSRRHGGVPMAEQAAIGAALFFALAPGFAVQYVVLAAPLLCLVDLRAGAFWGWTSGLFIGGVYYMFMIPQVPVKSLLWGLYPFPATVIGMVAWAGLTHFAWRRIRRLWILPATLANQMVAATTANRTKIPTM